MGVGVAVFILISGWGLVMDTLSPLLGEAPVRIWWSISNRP